MKKAEPKVNGVVVDAAVLEHELNAKMKKLKKLQKRVEKVQKELDLPGSAYPRLQLEDLHAGLPYSAIRKTIQSWAYFFSPQCQTTYRAVDPGLRDVITWVDFFQEEDVRESGRSISSKFHHDAIGTSWRQKKNVGIVKRHLGEKEYDSLRAEAAAKNQWDSGYFLYGPRDWKLQKIGRYTPLENAEKVEIAWHVSSAQRNSSNRN